MEHVCPGLASDEPYSSIQRIRNLKNLHSVDRTVIVITSSMRPSYRSSRARRSVWRRCTPCWTRPRAPHPLALSAKPYNPGTLRPSPNPA